MHRNIVHILYTRSIRGTTENQQSKEGERGLTKEVITERDIMYIIKTITREK